MLPHFHITGMQGVCVFLFVVALFGSAHLLAASRPDSELSKAWFGLGF